MSQFFLISQNLHFPLFLKEPKVLGRQEGPRRICNLFAYVVHAEFLSSGITWIFSHYTVKPVFKTTWEIGTHWELRTATSVHSRIHYVKMDLRNKTTSEFRTVFLSLLGVPNSQVSLYNVFSCKIYQHNTVHHKSIVNLSNPEILWRENPWH